MISLLSTPLPLSVCSVPSEQGSALSVCIVSKKFRTNNTKNCLGNGGSLRAVSQAVLLCLIQLHLPFFLYPCKADHEKADAVYGCDRGGYADEGQVRIRQV